MERRTSNTAGKRGANIRETAQQYPPTPVTGWACPRCGQLWAQVLPGVHLPTNPPAAPHQTGPHGPLTRARFLVKSGPPAN